MEPLRIEEVVQACRGQLLGSGRKTVTGVSTDSRTVTPGDLFFAIKGERFDGHSFCEEAVKRGAAALVISDATALPAAAQAVVVQDTRQALNDLAAFYRRKLPVRVVAVTGSNGKTTTREMIATILAGKFRVVSAFSSYNNDIGVPLTVFRMGAETEIGVFEIEMNRLGGTRALARVCQPEVGVVTNVGDTHLEFMKSRYGVSLEKAELLAELSEKDWAVVNADDPAVMNISGRVCRSGCITFGLRERAEVFATDIVDLGLEGTSFKLQGEFPVRLAVPGRHNIMNFLAACGAARALGMEYAQMPERISCLRLPEHRLQVFRLGTITLIDDCYNANPQSMEAALDLLSRSAEAGRRVAFLGDMLELGGFAEEAHSALGQQVARCADRVAFVGHWGQHAAAVAVKAKMDPSSVRLYADSGEAVAELFDIVRPGDTILVKGSRQMRLEVIVQEIVNRYGKESDKVH